MKPAQLIIARTIGIFVVATGIVYISWRWAFTLNMNALWLAIPLAIAETYSLGEAVLYTFTMWHARKRPSPRSARPGLSVDIFITTYNEPLELVLKTALAAKGVTYPHKTWILDDGQRPEFETAALHLGVGYITRGAEWEGKPRFAKAGNINNALFQTDGEFIAILDADQVPSPMFLDHVLGYFEDEAVAFVQTPQEFWNVGKADPLGSRAELFYGPIQRGKDGWDAAFFCGSNAVLRREALMALGLSSYTSSSLATVRRVLRRAKMQTQDLRARWHRVNPAAEHTAVKVIASIARCEAKLRRGQPLVDILDQLADDIAESQQIEVALPDDMLVALAQIESEITHIASEQALVINPMRTNSITEDMVTALHLHAMGWSSVYHHEVLVQGLAPEDLKTMLSQRNRWALGTMQVFFMQNPLFVPGLSLGQRLMYLSTMTSYLNGFAAVTFLAAPIVYLTTGIFPLNADPVVFFAHFLPFFLLCQAFFQVTGHGCRGIWKGQQMSIALFPTWIEATIKGLVAATTGRRMTFSVTSKTKSEANTGFRWIIPQLAAMGLLLTASGVGVARMAFGASGLPSTIVSLAWVAIDMALLWAAVSAARYRGPKASEIAAPSMPQHELLAALLTSSTSSEPNTLSEQLRQLRVSPSVPMKDDAAIGSKVHAIGPILDAHAALGLRNAVAAELGGHRNGHERIILVDVSKVISVSSAGIACLMQTLHLVRAEGSDMRIFGVSQALDTASLSYRINGLTRVYKGLAEAWAAHPSGAARKAALDQSRLGHAQPGQPQPGQSPEASVSTETDVTYTTLASDAANAA
ncbi:glycosyltransferase [Bifidobacterium sp.]|jgi:cellulose synthase (UDP-forming)|uniref:glycosyltransferase n=1 Tax=Bifidobacterium sp. TaxID=41200 RepID=UPI0025C582C0|nr:glycosyltransferase [Bifidobacterium sp.]MCH4209401.1 glycosyltransferase [Bifidobacterium sp.]MCI1224980.1 glycosyltransferase [Bifidobacterium sp.]